MRWDSEPGDDDGTASTSGVAVLWATVSDSVAGEYRIDFAVRDSTAVYVAVIGHLWLLSRDHSCASANVIEGLAPGKLARRRIRYRRSVDSCSEEIIGP
jgi:hypothetical protein